MTALSLTSVQGWLSRAFSSFAAIGERRGAQVGLPSTTLVPGTSTVGPDGAMQISAVWACVERRAAAIASLPFFAYEEKAGGMKELARASRLYGLLHDSPNGRMTPLEFWRAMIMSHDLRGNAYARLDRVTPGGEVAAMWPMPSDQTRAIVLRDGSMVYEYRFDSDVYIYPAEDVLHLKGLGNGTVGLAKLDFMRATTHEMAAAQATASRVFGNDGKPTGLLMVDSVLKPEQRDQLFTLYGGMAHGPSNGSRLFLLPANLKYEQLSLSPEDQQLLATRQFGIEEICRWFDVPPVLVYHSNVTTWGSGVEQIIDGWYKLAIRPMLVGIEQAVRKRVLTSAQRARMSVEFSLDALLRGNAKDRAELFAKLVQNGLKTRNEVRQLENDPPDPSPLANALTVQSNLLPIEMLGKVQPSRGSNASAQDPVAQ